MMHHIDDDGYLRYEDKRLVHRQMAFYEIFQENSGEFDNPFSYYDVHHKDGIKTNNKISNLQILTREEHMAIHGLSSPELREKLEKEVRDFVNQVGEKRKEKPKKTTKKRKDYSYENLVKVRDLVRTREDFQRERLILILKILIFGWIGLTCLMIILF
ncbi:MAG: HNH endonuclease [archaeon]